MSDEPWADLLPPDLTGHDALQHEAPTPEHLDPEPANREERRAAGERGPQSHRGHVVAGTGLAAAIATLAVASVFGAPVALLTLGGAAAVGGVGAGAVAARRALAKRRLSANSAGRTASNRTLRRAARQFGSALRTGGRTRRTGDRTAARTGGRTGGAKPNRTRFGRPKLGSNSARTRFGSGTKPNRTARTGFGSVGRTGGKKSSGSVRPQFGSAGRGSMKGRGNLSRLGPKASGSRRGPVGALRSRLASRKAGVGHVGRPKPRSAPSRAMRKAVSGARRAAQRLSPTRRAQRAHQRQLRRERRAKSPQTRTGRRAMRKVARTQQRTARATARMNDVIKRRSEKRQRRWEKRDRRKELRRKARRKSRKRWLKRGRRALAYRPAWWRRLRETGLREVALSLGASLLNLLKQVPGWVWAPKVKSTKVTPAQPAMVSKPTVVAKAKPARARPPVDNVMPKPVKRVNISKPRMTTKGTGHMHSNIEAIVEEFQRGIAGYELPDTHAVPDVNDFLESFSGMFSQMGDAIVSLGEKWDSDEPVEHSVAEFMKEVGSAVANMGSDADEVYETWRTEHEADIERFENPRNGEEKMNV